MPKAYGASHYRKIAEANAKRKERDQSSKSPIKEDTTENKRRAIVDALRKLRGKKEKYGRQGSSGFQGTEGQKITSQGTYATARGLKVRSGAHDKKPSNPDQKARGGVKGDSSSKSPSTLSSPSRIKEINNPSSGGQKSKLTYQQEKDLRTAKLTLGGANTQMSKEEAKKIVASFSPKEGASASATTSSKPSERETSTVSALQALRDAQAKRKREARQNRSDKIIASKPKEKKPKKKKEIKVKPRGAPFQKSLDEISGYISGMLQVTKREAGFKTRVTGVNLDTKMRHGKDEGTGKRNVKEVKTGNRYNLQSRIGDAAEKSLYGSFNSLLDAYQYRWFNKAKDFMGNETGKVTESAYGKGKKRGADMNKKPKAIGESKQDQQVMQS